jgi:hypothetical protein
MVNSPYLPRFDHVEEGLEPGLQASLGGVFIEDQGEIRKWIRGFYPAIDEVFAKGVGAATERADEDHALHPAGV